MTFEKNTFTKVVMPIGDGGGGGRVENRTLPVGASQTIKRGDLLVLSSGKLVQAVSLPGSNNTWGASGGSLGTIFIAGAPITTDGSPTQDDEIPVIPLESGNGAACLMRLYDGTSSNAVHTNVTIDTLYQIGRWRGASADEWWYALSVTSTNGDLRLLKFSPESDEADEYGLVVVGG